MSVEKSKSFDHLKILTKAQIIDYLKNHIFFHAPEEKTVQRFLWEKMSKENLKAMDNYNSNSKERESLAKKIDALAEEFNNSKQKPSEKIKILERRESLLEKLKSDHQIFSKLMEKSGKIDKFYNSIG